MTVDYPPSRTLTLGDAHERAQERADSDRDDSDQWERYADALGWAVEQFGGGAEVVVEAFTAASRARILDEARRSTVGELGPERTRSWLVGGSVTAAPWIDADADLADRVQATTALPPTLVDWLDTELEDLNDLGN